MAPSPGTTSARTVTPDPSRPDPRHDTRTAAILGVSLGMCFTVCFATGLFSHLAQHPTGWFVLPARPAGLYRVTQGVHVATGIATIPLLLAKLWAVYPKFFRWPAVTSLAHALERLSLVPLVAGAIFLLFSGTANIDLWYPLPLFFPAGHYWMAWLTMGALIVHVGAKATLTRHTLSPARSGRRANTTTDDREAARGEDVVRRRFLTLVAAGAGLLTIATVGETVGPLRGLALLAARRPDVGDQGFPVNNAAAEAHVIAPATDPAWRLRVAGAVARPMELSLDDLRALPLHQAELPIACVEGWSTTRTWRGVRLLDLLDHVGAPPHAAVTVRSLESGLYAQSDVNRAQAHDPDTLLALEVDGATLSLDHGYPVRLIGPDRPGVLQTKWLSQLEVHA